MRKSKIPTKNRKKLKQVDPFNKKGAAIRSAALDKKNFEPALEQVESRRFLELQKSMECATKQDVKKRKQKKNHILDEAGKMGLSKGRFESISNFLNRVDRTTRDRLNDIKTAEAKGDIGRATEELDAEFQMLEDKEKAKKDQAKREVQNKIAKAKKERAEREKILQAREDAKQARLKARRIALGEEEPEEEEEDHEQMNDSEGDDLSDDGVSDDDEARPAKRSKKEAVVKEKKVNLRAEKKKDKKIAIQEQKINDAILNSREVIAFGERYDAPPTFSGIMKKQLDPLMAKAGGKQLLLHSILAKETGVATEYLEDDSKKKKPDEEERLRVIEAYRKAKRDRYQNN